nr:ABC transporter permease [Rhodococcus sp. 06-621-2]
MSQRPRVSRHSTFERTTFAAAASVLVLALAWALLPSLFTSGDPLQTGTAARLQAPSAAHLFGTDLLGRDVYTRVVHGAARSLSGAAFAVTIGLVVGVMVGLCAGYLGGIAESALMRLVDVLLAVPGLLLAMAIVVAFGFGTINAAIAVGVGSIATFARLTRSEVLRVREMDYVEAAVGSGSSKFVVMIHHVLPNCARPVLALVALQFGSAILALATLGYLGYGTAPPDPEWGLLIADGRDYMAVAWWLTVLPGLVIVAVVLAAGRLGAGIGKGR